MLCQNCNLNEASIHLYTSLNGKQKQVDLCQNCYQIMKTDANNPILGGLHSKRQDSSISPFFDDFFGDLNHFKPFGQLPNTPQGNNQQPPIRNDGQQQGLSANNKRSCSSRTS